jgi:hypothetical protein
MPIRLTHTALHLVSVISAPPERLRPRIAVEMAIGANLKLFGGVIRVHQAVAFPNSVGRILRRQLSVTTIRVSTGERHKAPAIIVWKAMLAHVSLASTPSGFERLCVNRIGMVCSSTSPRRKLGFDAFGRHSPEVWPETANDLQQPMHQSTCR